MTVRIGGVALGAGRPKVCVPLVGSTTAALEAEARSVGPGAADLVELRIDRFGEVGSGRAVEGALDAVRAALDPVLPILLTCRSAREGGGADLPPRVLESLTRIGAAHPAVAAVDVEMAAPDGLAATLIGIVQASGRPPPAPRSWTGSSGRRGSARTS